MHQTGLGHDKEVHLSLGKGGELVCLGKEMCDEEEGEDSLNKEERGD